MSAPEQNQYYKDGVERVLDLMRSKFGGYFKAYYNGQPEDIPESMLPCVMVTESDGEIDTGATGTDTIVENIIIILVANRKDDIGADPETDLTELKLRRLVKGQDPQTGQYLTNTVMHALRTNLSLDNVVIGSSIRTDFAFNSRGEEVDTQEAYIQLTIERLAFIPYRT